MGHWKKSEKADLFLIYMDPGKGCPHKIFAIFRGASWTGVCLILPASETLFVRVD